MTNLIATYFEKFLTWFDLSRKHDLIRRKQSHAHINKLVVKKLIKLQDSGKIILYRDLGSLSPTLTIPLRDASGGYIGYIYADNDSARAEAKKWAQKYYANKLAHAKIVVP